MPFETFFDMVNIETKNKTFYGTVKCDTFSVNDFAMDLCLQQANSNSVRKVTMITFENLLQTYVVTKDSCIFFIAHGAKHGKEKDKIVFHHENIF